MYLKWHQIRTDNSRKVIPKYSKVLSTVSTHCKKIEYIMICALNCLEQCWGSGTGFLYRRAKIVRKTLIPTVLWLLYDFLSWKNDVNVPSKRNEQKTLEEKNGFVGILRVKDENSRIWIRIHWSEVRIRGSGSVPKCHGSTTLALSN